MTEIAIVPVPTAPVAPKKATGSRAVRTRRRIRGCGKFFGRRFVRRLCLFVCSLHRLRFRFVVVVTVVVRRGSVALEKRRQTRRRLGSSSCIIRCILSRALPRKPLASIRNPLLNVLRSVSDADAKALHPAALGGDGDSFETRVALVLVAVHHVGVRLDNFGGGFKAALLARDVTARVGVQGGGRIQLQIVAGAADERFLHNGQRR